MGRSFTLSAALQDYVVDHSTLPDDELPELARRTAELGDVARMQIGAEQGAMLTALTKLSAGHFAVEVGTFTGYSAICIARGLAAGGRLLCCDISTEWTDMAREAWRRAGVDDRIDLAIGPAAETLTGLDSTPVDFAFIDADKGGYRAYLDLLLPKLADHGMIVVDNVLWSGAVTEPRAGAEADANLSAITAFNDHVAQRDDCDVAMLPVGDGVSLITRRR